MPARQAVATQKPQKAQRELEDLQLVMKARNGSQHALDALMRRYTGFVRLKASSYFLAGGESDDLIQEGMIGLYKAVRDFRADKETSFRSFAELCVTRQIITAIKTATRFKHAPLNTYVSFSHTPAGQESEGDCTLGDALPGPSVDDPSVCVISTEELQALVGCLGSTLSTLESEALRLYLEGLSYEGMAEELGCDTKTIDNALQRVKRKILAHQQTRQVLA
jgi:RNA polymerase sporulation-specific sigma factor